MITANLILPETPFDTNLGAPIKVMVYASDQEQAGPYVLVGEPIVQVATAPAGPNAVELLWEVNDMRPYDGRRYHSSTAVFTSSGQREFLKDKSFKVLASLDGEKFTEIASVRGPTNRFLHKNAHTGWLYHYKVRAFDADGKMLAESPVTLCAAGKNLVLNPGHENHSLGAIDRQERRDDADDAFSTPPCFAVVAGRRPYSRGTRVIKFDPLWARKRESHYYGNLIPISSDKLYLQGGWVRAPGNVWLGRWFSDVGKSHMTWAYSMPGVRKTSEWTFGVQLLQPDNDKTGHKRDGNGRPYEMALKHWTFPLEARYIEPYIVAFGPGECDDHWIVEAQRAPTGATVAAGR